MKQLLKELESECRSAANFQNSPAIWFAPAGAVDELINSQKKAYKMLVAKFKISSLQEKIEILKETLKSKDLSDGAKVGLFAEGVNSFDELIKDEQKDDGSRS